MHVPSNYRIPFSIAIVLHLLVLIFLIIDLSSTKTYQQEASPAAPNIVKATTINQEAVLQQVAAIKKEAELKRATENARIKKLEAAAKKAKALRIAEQKRIAQFKAEQVRLAQEAALHAKKLAAQKALEKKERLLKKQKDLQNALLQQQLQQEQNDLAKRQAAEMKGAIDQYRAAVLSAIRQNWHPLITDDSIYTQLLVHLNVKGTVLNVDIVKTSGNVVLDRSARVAVIKSSPLPVPKDPVLFEQFREFRIKMSPKDLR